MSKWTFGIGIDPGFASVGVCIARYRAMENVPVVVATIRTNRTKGAIERLDFIAQQLNHYFDSFDLAFASYEDQSGVTVGTHENVGSRRVHEVVGMVRALSHAYHVPCHLIHPTTAKLVVAGSGRAKKADVKKAVAMTFRMQGRFSEHAADACAVWLAGKRRALSPQLPPPALKVVK